MHLQLCSIVLLLAVDVTRVLASTIPHEDGTGHFNLLDDHYDPLEPQPKDQNGGVMAKISQWFLGPPPAARRHGQQGHHHPPKTVTHVPNYSRYMDDVVLRFNITSSEEAAKLAKAVDDLYLDVWSATKKHADIRLDARMVEPLLDYLPKSMHHSHRRLIHDLASTIRETFPAPKSRASSRVSASVQDLFFAEYQPLNVIYEWMKLHSILSPGHVTPFTVGSSFEGRDISGLKVFGGNQDPNVKKQAIIVTGAAHAREWISVSTVCYLAYTFITHYSEKKKPNGKFDKDITDLVDSFDWYFIPTLNVDGYVYSWKEDRLWRKNRQPTSLRFCRGVELDRSYSYQWNAQVSSNPCSENYPGEQPFEAMEAKAFAEWAHNLTSESNTQIMGFLDLHSYSQQILYPYSYSCAAFPPDLENLEELAMDLAKAIRMGPDGEHYEVQSACEGGGWQIESDKGSIQLTETGGGGSALDYFYGNLSVPYSYQIKLRDKGSYGFLLPSRNIGPTGEEAVAMTRRFGKFLKESSMTAKYHPKPGFALRR